MRKLMIVIGILFLIPTFSIAQDTIGGIYDGVMSKGKEERKKSETLESPGGMMYEIRSIHMYLMGHPIRHILHHADDLRPTDMERKELKGLEEKYLYSLIDREAGLNLRVAQMKFTSPFTKPAFNTGDTKIGIQSLTDTVLGTAEDVLPAIRKDLGPENFKKAIEIPMGNGMMMKVGVSGGMMGLVVYWRERRI